MSIIKPPFNLSVLMAEYVYNQCLLCHSLPSASNHETSNFKKGIICNACHESISWLPNCFSIELNATNSQNTLRRNVNPNQATQEKLVIQPATYYQHPIDKIILAFKSGDMSVLPILVHIIQQLPKPKGCDITNSVIVPVPTTQNRLITRGFNPLATLSAYLSHHWQIPLANVVQRVDYASSQKSLNRQQRIVNVQGAFELSPQNAKKIANKNIILFDDVVTTGSTLTAFAAAIRNKTVSLPKLLPLRGYCLAHVSRV